MGDPLLDSSALISAAATGKLRLVRLLVEGGAQVNGCNPRGETPLLAACKALKGEPDGPETMKLLSYLLQNKADPNTQDRAGRTALMYACMERAGAQVASTLLAAGADPSMEDYLGASALVYAINAQHQPTLKVLMEACRARGHDIIIIATEMGEHGGPVTRRYLNVPPSPDTSPVSCMSPSDIVLKAGSPSSPEGENIFNFQGSGKRGSGGGGRQPSRDAGPVSQTNTPPPRQRILSEPWLTPHSLARLNRVYEEGMKERSLQEQREAPVLWRETGEKEDAHFHPCETEGMMGSVVQGRGKRHGIEVSSSQAALSRSTLNRCPSPGGPTSSVCKLPAYLAPHSQLRRNTLASVAVLPPVLHLPPSTNQRESHLLVPVQLPPSKGTTVAFEPHPPASSPPSSSSTASVKPGLLPQIPFAPSLVSPLASCSEKGRRSRRPHSAQEDRVRGAQITTNH